jgi:hypothetical protein
VVAVLTNALGDGVLGIELNQTGFVVVDQQNGMEQAHWVVSLGR